MLQSECGEKETFGANFNYKIKEFKISQESNVLNENTFVATVLVNVCDEQEIETFLTEFKEISNMDYNKKKWQICETIWSKKMYSQCTEKGK